MTIPTVRLIAEIPLEYKQKIKRVALKRDTTIRELLMHFIEELPESGWKRKWTREKNS